MKYFIFLVLTVFTSHLFADCASDRVRLQILGSGGPELTDQRASTSYLVWVGDKAQVLVDVGGGSSLNFEKTGAGFEDIKVIVLTHLHVDHSADLPVYIKASYFTSRLHNLKIYGPEGNNLMPSTYEYVHNLIGSQGAFRYLDNYLSSEQRSAYKIDPINVLLDQPRSGFRVDNIQLTAMPVHHGPIAAVAWRIDVEACSLTFSGDMSNKFNVLSTLAKDTDVLVAHNAIPEDERGFGRVLHMVPSTIGKIAKQASVRRLILSHRMKRSLGQEEQTLREIRANYKGPVEFANDLDEYTL
jgi:ribonuclease BN (tRNA processing enzyme)